MYNRFFDYVLLLLKKIFSRSPVSGLRSSPMLLSFPPYNPRVKEENGKEYIFDPLRKQWVRLTPEEWVRQHFINYLVEVLDYPAKLIAIEKQIHMGELQKRFDILVYKNDKPWMIVECKEQQAKLNDTVLTQVFQYQSVIGAEYIVLTNGEETFCGKVVNGTIHSVTAVPPYKKSGSI